MINNFPTIISRIYNEFAAKNIKLNDPRLKDMIKILDNYESNNQDIDFEIFKSIVKPKYKLFKSVLQNQMVIKNCKLFKARTQKIFDEIEQTDYGGFLPSYIPALKKVEPDKFAVSICTVDGQIFNFGDTKHHATQQAISSVLSYLIALDQHGQETISSFIGTEPSGQAFNSLELLNGKPHNPLINSGNLTCCSLMYKDETIDRKYELYSKVIKRLIGGHKVHFNNEVYLSEFAHADRNCCLLYMLKEKGILPKDADIKKILQFYTQTWAIEVSVEEYAILAGSLANGGICPRTDDRVFEDSNAVKGVLSQMLSWGMNTYSGLWAFQAGLPAKSSVSGMTIWVVPNIMGIAVYSPKLDKAYNSLKGAKFLLKFVQEFHYDDIDHVYSAAKMQMIDDKNKCNKDENDSDSFHLLYYAKQNKLREIRRSVAQGQDVNYCDYDQRTPLHLAANYGNFEVVKYLVSHGAYCHIKDRFDNTPLDEAFNNGYHEIFQYLQIAKEEQQRKHNLLD